MKNISFVILFISLAFSASGWAQEPPAPRKITLPKGISKTSPPSVPKPPSLAIPPPSSAGAGAREAGRPNGLPSPGKTLPPGVNPSRPPGIPQASGPPSSSPPPSIPGQSKRRVSNPSKAPSPPAGAPVPDSGRMPPGAPAVPTALPVTKSRSSDQGLLPASYSRNRYDKLHERNPFSLEIRVSAAEPSGPNDFADYALAGVCQVGDKKYATLVNTRTNQYQEINSKAPNDEKFILVSIVPDAVDARLAKVRVRRGTKTGMLEFSDTHLKSPAKGSKVPGKPKSNRRPVVRPGAPNVPASKGASKVPKRRRVILPPGLNKQ